MHYETSNTETDTPSQAVRYWLYFIVLLVAAMVIVGGATRLTDSGLSITEWKPIMGALPPMSESDWQDAFTKYKQIPEYKQVNKGMNMSEFKTIFWWEWGHRFLGRFVGLAFFIPLVFFWMTGRISDRLKWPLVGVFVLGGLQGLMGWYMVMSGLVERIDVSQYRLAAHLGLAIVIMGIVYWIAEGMRKKPREYLTVLPMESRHVRLGWLFVGLVFLQFLLGALVAGLDAGKIYNTWPLMEGALIPSDLFEKTPWFINLFENRLTVQFDHRMLAYLLIIFALIYALIFMRTTDGILQNGAWFIFGLLMIQVLLGITTLLMVAPISLSLIHQGVAVILFLAIIWHVRMVYEAHISS